MTCLGYHASQEQFAPSDLLRYAVLAQQAGFRAIHSSDHFAPWSERQGQSGFSFAWLGAAMQATTLPFGLVCAPGQRYHPAIVAQAIATLCELFPERLWVSLGSGEAMNEHITGTCWPEKETRNTRLHACATIIRQLLEGTTVNSEGVVRVHEAKLYTIPEKMPRLLGAALSEETAGWLGSWADGMITVNQRPDKLSKVLEAFRKGGGEGKPVYLKMQLSYADSDTAALMGAHDQWRNNILPPRELAGLWCVADLDKIGNSIPPHALHEFVHISSDLQKHIDWIAGYASMGFEAIILHNVNRQQEMFIHAFGEKVLPSFS